MVVRLGSTSTVEVVNSQRYRIKQGQSLQLQHISSENAVPIVGWARVRYDNGMDTLLTIPEFTTSTDPIAVALASPSDVATMDGWVTDAVVSLPLDSTVKRGQIYVKLFFDPLGPVLCTGYVFATIGALALGSYSDPGPGGGSGNLTVVTVKANGAPVAATDHTLAGVGQIRRVYGWIWYYVASADVATRTLQPIIRDSLGALPTGMSSGGNSNQWVPASLVLTASQQGSIFANEHRTGSSDAGTLSIANTTTAPNPFSILVHADDPGLLRFSTTNGNANDFDAIYLLREEWVVPG